MTEEVESKRKKLPSVRIQEKEILKGILKEVKNSFPKSKGTNIKIKFLIWFDSENHNNGMWYLATTCYHTRFVDRKFFTYVKILLKKNKLDTNKLKIVFKDYQELTEKVVKNNKIIKIL